METTESYNTIRYFLITRGSIVITEEFVTMPEYLEMMKYLNWIRSSSHGSYEAIRYTGKGLDYIDTIISERTRVPLFTFNYSTNEEVT